MFPFLYSGQIVALIEKHPREVVGGFVAVTLVTELARRYFEVRKMEVKCYSEARLAELNVELETIKLERLKFEQSSSNV